MKTLSCFAPLILAGLTMISTLSGADGASPTEDPNASPAFAKAEESAKIASLYCQKTQPNS